MLEKTDNDLIGPRDFHDRHGWKLRNSESRIQNRLDEIQIYAERNDMSVNLKKTCILPFCWSRKYDFMPNITYNNQNLEVVYKTKLLGVVVESSGRWNSHIDYLTNKAKH